MPTFRHSTHGTVVTTTAAMGEDWELVDPQSPAKKTAPKKAAPKKAAATEDAPASDDKE